MRLDPAARPEAEAWLALRRDDPQAAILLAALPQELHDQPALMLEFARWLRRAGRDKDALALWRTQGEAAQRAASPEHLAAFWTERNLLARRLLRAGRLERRLRAGRDGGTDLPRSVAEAEFLAGFIALRRLNDPDAAARHFRSIGSVARAAISQARAHYWLGRALAAAGAEARPEFALAAAIPLTFYGQLAAQALGEGPAALGARIRALKDPGWTQDQVLDFAGRETVRAAAMVVAWGEPRRAQAFLLRVDELAPDATDRSIAARLALGFGLPETAVAIARRMGRDGLALPDAGWPLPVNPPEGAIDPAVTLGLIRQESSFDVGAASPVGARGLMQLMPLTAQAIAKRVGEQTSLIALTTDAAHNMRLGTAYLRDTLDRFDGSLPLALAAYNAGPNRVTGVAGRERRPAQGRGGHGGLDRTDPVLGDAQLRAARAGERGHLPGETG